MYRVPDGLAVLQRVFILFIYYFFFYRVPDRLALLQRFFFLFVEFFWIFVRILQENQKHASVVQNRKSYLQSRIPFFFLFPQPFFRVYPCVTFSSAHARTSTVFFFCFFCPCKDLDGTAVPVIIPPFFFSFFP